MDENMKDCLEQASLYLLLAKKYEYVDPEKHMYFYQKHFYYAEMVDKMYMHMEGNMSDQHGSMGYYNNNNMMY